MATQIICDACGEPIDQSQPYFQVVATKVQVENINDPSLPNTPTVVAIAQSFDYHDGHQPLHDEQPPEVEEPALALTSIEPTTIAKGTEFTLRALGTGFIDGAKVVLNNVEQDTTFISSIELMCSPDTSQMGKSIYDVLVRQDGTDTGSYQFTVT